ncbi:hypothetical protein CDAR_412791 [Caerostris darwini]|uniref:Uncharacterized protein n=1 Tax=Caerostris darwini TaxID=1538125 RepID=A0AAV4SHE5_9ARAC|nr:hypothetical protein CDAR_412791 [Caerostris darwini]
MRVLSDSSFHVSSPGHDSRLFKAGFPSQKEQASQLHEGIKSREFWVGSLSNGTPIECRKGWQRGVDESAPETLKHFESFLGSTVTATSALKFLLP